MSLTAIQWKFIAARLLANSDREAAEKVGINPSTPSNWKQEFPEFAQEYEAAFTDGVHVAKEYMRKCLGKAADVLYETLSAKDARGKPDHTARLTATKLLLQSHGLLSDRQIVSGDKDNPVEMVVNIVRSTGNRKIDNAAGETPSPGTDS